MVTTKACQARFGVVSALRERIHASLESFHVIGHHRVIVEYILQGRLRSNFTSPIVSVLIYLRTLDSSHDAEQFNSRLGERNSVGNDASLRGTGDQTSLHPCLRDICAALLYHIHSLETPPELE